MQDGPKWLVAAGLVLVVAGLIWNYGGKWIPFGRLPGDIRFESGNVKVYFPIVTCLVVSILLSAAFYIARWFK